MKAVNNNIVVVALHKSGTNLIKLALTASGFNVAGQGISESYQRWWVKGCVFRGWLAAGNDLTSLRAEIASRFFKKAGSLRGANAVFVHWLPMGKYLRNWVTSNSPKIVFHFRDPRAIAVSLYHYLLSDKIGSDPILRMMSKILRSLPDEHSRYEYLIEGTTPYFAAIRESMWLRFHPDVLCTKYESLVGGAGGGTDADQAQCLHTLLDRLNRGHRRAEAVAALNARDSRTFRTGNAHSWRRDFPDSLLRRFERRYGDIIEGLGYAPVT